MKFTSSAERNLKAPASWPLPIICGHYSMWRKQSTPSKSHNGSWHLACVSSLHKRRFVLFSYFLFLHFFRKRLTITSVWRSCARFAWKMRKLIKPFMQTKVRLPSDTLPGASQWADQTTLFLVYHSPLLLSATFTLSIWPASFIKKYLSLSGFSNWFWSD